MLILYLEAFLYTFFFSFSYLFFQWIVQVQGAAEMLLPVDEGEELVHLHGEVYVNYLPPVVSIIVYIFHV